MLSPILFIKNEHMYSDATVEDINESLNNSAKAFDVYKKRSLHQRADLLRSIAKKLLGQQDQLLAISNKETRLGESRLQTELLRTIFQLNSYAAACEEGNWLDIRIDAADPDRNPPKPDLRKI